MSNDMLVRGATICGSISAIASKSYVHRIAICDFLAGNIAAIQNLDDNASNDIKATKNCLLALQNGDTLLDCGESGSTLRFLIPLALCLRDECCFTGQGRLMDRPNDELFECLRANGIDIYKDGAIIRAKGKLTAGEYAIRGDVSSQYISGLLMALPMLPGDSRITLTTPLVSSPYVDITLEVLSQYGIDVKRDLGGFSISGNAHYQGSIPPQGDWSNAAFFLVLGAIAGQVRLDELNLSSVQGDKVILDVLRSAGATIICDTDCVTTKKSTLVPFVLDAEHCPDLVPIASVLAACAQGVSTISNISRLKIKESDRVQTTIAMLGAFGIEAKEVDNSLVIYGGAPCAGGRIDSYNDHRIAMAASILASAVSGDSIIKDYKAVNKSYPAFYQDLKKLGGIAYEV